MPRSKSGTVYERRPNVWECAVTCGTRADGTRRTMRSTVHGTEQDAWAEVRRIERALDRDPSLGRGVTLADVWTAYRAARGAMLAPKTLKGYDWYMSDMWLPALGGRDVTAITKGDVQRVMLSTTRHKADQGRRVLSAVLSWAVRAGSLNANPLLGERMELPGDVGGALGGLDDADDPFAAIEGARDVWDVVTVMRCFSLVRGLPLEPCWLACVGAGLRVEEALALRKVDVRRVAAGGVMVTQLAVHRARTDVGGVKSTKTRRSVRIVSVAEPFGERLWELADELPDRDDLLCPMSAQNQNARWRGYFAEPAQGETAKHRPKGEGYAYTGRLRSLPYLPMGRMRATHETLMQQAGVLDSINAAYHGHSEVVSYAHYQRPDTVDAAARVGEMLRLVAG